MGAQRHDIAVGLCHRQLGVDGLLPYLTLGYQPWEGEVGVGAGDKVGVVVGDESLFHTLGHAAQHTEDDTLAAVAVYII